MNTLSNKADNKRNNIIFMIFVFLLLANVSAFAQTSLDTNSVLTTTIENTTAESNVAKEEANTSASSMNFVLWFMGSKQDPNVKTIKAGENTRRQFITSGLAPNRLLLKAFLKKAVNSEIAAA